MSGIEEVAKSWLIDPLWQKVFKHTVDVLEDYFSYLLVSFPSFSFKDFLRNIHFLIGCYRCCLPIRQIVDYIRYWWCSVYDTCCWTPKLVCSRLGTLCIWRHTWSHQLCQYRRQLYQLCIQQISGVHALHHVGTNFVIDHHGKVHISYSKDCTTCWTIL